MKTKKQIPDFLPLGIKLLDWYQINGRQLPFRTTREPYKIWICEIIFQQTRIAQGMSYYSEFVKRFPTVSTLANAHLDDVLLQWKGLGYYSRAINLHKTAKVIIEKYNGNFPNQYEEILQLPGIGKYTAAAICSICFHEPRPAVDGNFYRVLSRVFADDYDVSQSQSFQYFSTLAEKLMPIEKPGLFNQAMMDLGAMVCKVKNPSCDVCPFNKECAAFLLGGISDFPVKLKKTVVRNEKYTFYFIHFENQFLIQQRDDAGIWKKLYQFPTQIPLGNEKYNGKETEILHTLTHRKLKITIVEFKIENCEDYQKIAKSQSAISINFSATQQYSFPKPLENYLKYRLL